MLKQGQEIKHNETGMKASIKSVIDNTVTYIYYAKPGLNKDYIADIKLNFKIL